MGDTLGLMKLRAMQLRRKCSCTDRDKRALNVLVIPCSTIMFWSSIQMREIYSAEYAGVDVPRIVLLDDTRLLDTTKVRLLS